MFDRAQAMEIFGIVLATTLTMIAMFVVNS